jgi:hypothetical protein
MHDDQTIQRFIELRAQGWTYARLMAELKVTKPTLITWSRKHQFQIQTLKAIELEALGEEWLASVSDRVRQFGQQLRRIEAEPVQSDPAKLTTVQLHLLTRRLLLDSVSPIAPGGQLSVVRGPVVSPDQVQDWQG